MSHWSYVNNQSQEIVEAYQWYSDSGQHTIAYPRWLLDLLLDKRIETNDGGKSWWLDRMLQIRDGSWIIYHDGNKYMRFQILSDALFRDQFTKES